MRVRVHVGDVLETSADALIVPANPWLNMSGGVNGMIRERCPEIQEELRRHLESTGWPAVEARSVVLTSAATLPFRSMIHAVAIDPFYDSSTKLVSDTLRAAFELVTLLDARTVSLPTLATGYGRLPIAEFARAFSDGVAKGFDLDAATIVVRSEENASIIRDTLNLRS